MITAQKAKTIFRDHFFGTDAVASFFGEQVYAPEHISLSEELAVVLASAGFDLFAIPLVGEVERHLTPQCLMDAWERLYPTIPVLYDYHDAHKWYKNDPDSMYFAEQLISGWVCIKREPLEDAYFKTYKKQTAVLAQYLCTTAPMVDPSVIFNGMLQNLSSCDDFRAVLHPVNQHFRTSFGEELFRVMIVFHTQKIRLLGDAYVWTNSAYKEKELVRIGSFDETGMDVTKRDPFDGNSATGLSPIIHLPHS